MNEQRKPWEGNYLLYDVTEEEYDALKGLEGIIKKSVLSHLAAEERSISEALEGIMTPRIRAFQTLYEYTKLAYHPEEELAGLFLKQIKKDNERPVYRLATSDILLGGPLEAEYLSLLHEAYQTTLNNLRLEEDEAWEGLEEAPKKENIPYLEGLAEGNEEDLGEEIPF